MLYVSLKDLLHHSVPLFPHQEPYSIEDFCEASFFIHANDCIAGVFQVLEHPDGYEKYLIPPQHYGKGPSWAQLNQLFWAGWQQAIAFPDIEEREKMLGRGFSRVFLYRIPMGLVYELTPEIKRRPIASIPLHEAQEQHKIKAIISSPPIHVQKKELEELDPLSDHIVERFLVVRAENIRMGAHSIPVSRMSIHTQTSKPAAPLHQNWDLETAPKRKTFILRNESEAHTLLTRFQSAITDSDGKPIFWTQQFIKKIGPAALLRSRDMMIHGTPIAFYNQ